jgi:exonuclease III
MPPKQTNRIVKCLNVLHINIQSLRNKLLELEVLAMEHNADVICVNEHWMDTIELKATRALGFLTADAYCRNKYKNDGMSIFISDRLCLQPINVMHCFPNEDKIFESSVAGVNFNGVLFLVVSVYRSSVGDFNIFLDEWTRLLERIHTSVQMPNLILTGDFNCNSLDDSNAKKDFIALLLSFNIQLTNKEPTRVIPMAKSLLDIRAINI